MCSGYNIFLKSQRKEMKSWMSIHLVWLKRINFIHLFRSRKRIIIIRIPSSRCITPYFTILRLIRMDISFFVSIPARSSNDAMAPLHSLHNWFCFFCWKYSIGRHVEHVFFLLFYIGQNKRYLLNVFGTLQTLWCRSFQCARHPAKFLHRYQRISLCIDCYRL